MSRQLTRHIMRGGLIAAIYTVLGVMPGLSALSFGPIQFRVAESLSVLPILYVEAIPGLFVGALLVNLVSPVGMVDVVFGSLATLIAAIGTYRLRNTVWAYWSPVIINGLGVSLYLHAFFGWPYWLTVLSIGTSQALVVFTLGKLLIKRIQIHEEKSLRR